MPYKQPIDRATVERIADVLNGTCKSIEVAVEKILEDESLDKKERRKLERVPIEDVEDLLADFVERCPGCDWWMEPGELVNDDGDLVGCDQCREKEEDE